MAKKEVQAIKALSVAQPWAECIVSHGKNIENRNWNTRYRGFFAVHASRTVSKERFDACKDEYGIEIDPEEISYGSIVGFAELVDVITEDELTRKTKKWFMGEHGLVLANVIRLKKPVKVKGALSFWTLKGAALKEVMSQLSSSQRKMIFDRLLKLGDKM